MPKQTPDEEFRAILTGEHASLVRFRNVLKRAPHDPRCKLCAAPFEGIGGTVLRHIGFARFSGNPALCQNCINGFRKNGLTGAEIPVTLVFADVRGSTGIAERMRPTDFRAFLDRFYRIGSASILGHDGLVDKLVGDEVIGLFFGGVTGPDHATAAIAAAIDLMQQAGHSDASRGGPIPIGAGVHTGEAYVGTTGPAGAVDDFTALGDVVNATARLASLAGAGELLVSVAAASAAHRPVDGTERRTLEVRGRHEPIEVIVLRPT
ncbi:MAG TPA: adenylate/guanylate cyclase domain-containing protein [Candidatus Limnocylindrales bacterium]|nr:adenylate/guanylate cyclase domain-containing protein [Candidatus Limnocylindrales bacterium]